MILDLNNRPIEPESVKPEATDNSEQEKGRYSTKLTTSISAKKEVQPPSSSTPIPQQDAMMADLTKRKEDAASAYREALGRYKANGGNILLQHFEENKPKPKVGKAKRLAAEAFTAAMTDLLALVGKGVGAYGGVRQKDSENREYLSSKMDELSKLADLYEAEGTRWKENILRAKLQQAADEQSMAEMGIKAAGMDAAQAQGEFDAEIARRYNTNQKMFEASLRAQERAQDQAFKSSENAKDRQNRIAAASVRGSEGGGKDRDWLFNVSDGKGGVTPITNAALSEIKMWGKNHKNPAIRKLVEELEYQKTDDMGRVSGGIMDADKGAMVSRVASLQQMYQAERTKEQQSLQSIKEYMAPIISTGRKITADELRTLIAGRPELLSIGYENIAKTLKSNGLLNE